MYNQLNHLLILTILLFALCTTTCGDKKKELIQLTQEISKCAEKTEVVGKVLDCFSLIEQAKGLNSTKQCRAARDIYRAMWHNAKEGCRENYEVCNAIQTHLYDGSFPAGGMNICTAAVDEQCQKIRGNTTAMDALETIWRELDKKCK